MTKLDLRSVQDFNFDEHQGTEEKEKQKKPAHLATQVESIQKLASNDDSANGLDSASDDKSMEDLYMNGF